MMDAMRDMFRSRLKMHKLAMKQFGSSKGFGIFCIFVIWMVFALLAGIANYLDLQANGYKANLSRQLVLFSMLFLPIPFLGSVLYLFCEKYQDHIFRARNLILLLFFLLFLFLPLFTFYELFYLHMRATKSWPTFSDLLDKVSISQALVDGVVVLFAASMQIAYAYWRRTVRQFEQSTVTDEEILRLRLKRLQGQLEPGFLLHSLNQVANFVEVADQNKATRAIVRLSELLRYVLDSQHRGYLSIADEILFLKDYLELRNLHFNNHLYIDWDFADLELQDFQSPALLLHPILEFAIESIQEKLIRNKVSIRMSIREFQSSIQISVFFSPDENVPKASKENLKMARERLEILYGESATLQNIHADVLATLNAQHDSEPYSHGVVMVIPSQRN